MKKYKIVIKPSVKKSISKLSRDLQLRIFGVIDSLQLDPYPPNARKLEGRDGYRIRTGDYRIIYEVENQILTITVLVVGHRREVYRQAKL